MAKEYIMNHSSANKFKCSDDIISTVLQSIKQKSFPSFSLDLAELSIYCIQKKLIHLEEICEIYTSLVKVLKIESYHSPQISLEIPLWRACASSYYSDNKIEHIKGQAYLKSVNYLYDPKLLVYSPQETWKENDQITKVVYFRSGKIKIEEILETEVEQFSPPHEEPLRIFAHSFLRVSMDHV